MLYLGIKNSQPRNFELNPPHLLVPSERVRMVAVSGAGADAIPKRLVWKIDKSENKSIRGEMGPSAQSTNAL